MHANDIERGHGRRALERQQRNVRLAHGVAHVGPRHIAALAGNALGLIKDVVENGDALVGQTDLIHVRIDHAATIVGISLGERAPLVVDIATRLFDLGEQRLDQMKTVLVWNAQKKPLSSEIRCVLKGTHRTSSAGNRGHQVANARERGGSHLVGTAVVDVALVQRNERTAHAIGARGGGQRLDGKPNMRRLLYQARVTARITRPPASTPATS